MKAVKVYNNSAVSAVKPDGREVILTGSGIGFSKRPGDTIDEQKIEKTYYIQSELQTKFLQLLKDASPDAVRVAEDILEYARDGGQELKDQLLLSLIDHICFAIERYEQGIELPYLMLAETKMLYPREFKIGEWALRQIEFRCGVELPYYEAGYIALQLASASMSREMTYNTLKFVKGCTDIIRDAYNAELDPDNIDTIRLTTHLKFLAQRIFQRFQWEGDNMESLHEIFLNKHRKNKECIERLREYVQNEFDYHLNSQEEVYLLVHLSKIFYGEKEGDV